MKKSSSLSLNGEKINSLIFLRQNRGAQNKYAASVSVISPTLIITVGYCV